MYDKPDGWLCFFYGVYQCRKSADTMKNNRLVDFGSQFEVRLDDSKLGSHRQTVNNQGIETTFANHNDVGQAGQDAYLFELMLPVLCRYKPRMQTHRGQSRRGWPRGISW